MEMNPIGVFVPLGVVFPDVSNDFETFKALLSGLSRTDTLFWCARLNTVVANPANTDHRAKQEYGLHIFFTVEEIERINSFVRNRGGIDEVTVFSRGQLLELIRWVSLFCQDQPEDGVTFEKPEVRRTFAQAAMIANDLWAHRIYGTKFSLEGGREEARQRALGPIRQAIAELSSGMEPLKALGRGKALFSDYLPQFYPEVKKDFSTQTSLTLEQYYICLSALMTHCLNRTPEIVTQGTEHSGLFNVNTFCGQIPHMLDVFSRYFALESQTIEELRSGIWDHQEVSNPDEAGQYNMNILRRRPILRAPDGRAIILDPVFYAEKAAVGLLFLLSKSMSGNEANQLFSAFGYAFEAYATDILKRMYPELASGLIKRFTYNVKGKDQSGQEVQIADACLNDVSEVVLFEMKAVWLRDDVVLADNHDQYLDHLRKKYGVSVSNGATDSVKGVGQLARTISKLASGEWSPVEQDFRQAEVVYPVLLVYDPFLNAPVHGSFLAKEFTEVLSPVKQLQSGDMLKGPFRVAPLIVMTINDLESLEESVNHFSFRDLLRDYSSSCVDRVVSLHNFIAGSEYGKKMYHSKSIASKTLEVLEQTTRTLFPNDSRNTDETEKVSSVHNRTKR